LRAALRPGRSLRATHGRERGSVLVLVPAAVLVLVVLGGVSADAATAFLGQRQLVSAAQDAATDAVSAISEQSFYTSGSIVVDPAAAQAVAEQSVAAQDLGDVTLSGPPEIQVSGRQVCVTLHGRVRRIFGAAIPGIQKTVSVTGRATATAAGDDGASVPRRRLC
jgi:Flp pilus assembly protein TadG